MLLKLLGWIWVISGVIFLLKPDWLKGVLQKKSIKKVRKVFFALALFFGLLLIKAAWGVDHILAKVVMVLGVIGIIKAFFFLKAKAAERLIEWFSGQSITFFRGWAVGLVAFGAILLTV